MTSGRYGSVLREVGRLLAGGTVAGMGEGQLLERFAVNRDAVAFEALVIRHGPMVLGTCRRMLADPHDVDDAFQATFLVLARRAGSIRDADRLGPWLHGVARRVAARSRALSARRHARERPGGEEPAIESPDAAESAELRAAIDEELARLPEKYRVPLVLCYLDGLTHDEAAQRLRWPVGTVRSRLAGGRDRLRARLTRRGLAPSAAVPAILPHVSIPQALLSSTIRIATSAGSAPVHVLTLAKGALIAMTLNKLKVIAAVGLMAGLTVAGAGVAAQQGGNAPAVVPNKAKSEDEKRLEELIKKVETAKVAIPAAEKLARDLRENRDRAIAEIDALKKKLEKTQPPAPAPTKAPIAADPSALRKASPRVMKLGQGDLVLVIPAGLDRMTVLNIKTGERKTSRLPGTLTEVVPIFGYNLLAFGFKGPEIRRIAVFDFTAGELFTHDLREPVKGELNPILGKLNAVYMTGRSVYCYLGEARKWGVLEVKGATTINPFIFNSSQEMMAPILEGAEIAQVVVVDFRTGECFYQDLREPFRGKLTPIGNQAAVAYQAGRFVYAFSPVAKKWGVLELKGPARPTVMSHQIEGIIIPDGDLIHIFKADTGEWTHIDLKDEK